MTPEVVRISMNLSELAMTVGFSFVAGLAAGMWMWRR